MSASIPDSPSLMTAEISCADATSPSGLVETSSGSVTSSAVRSTVNTHEIVDDRPFVLLASKVAR